MTTRTDTMSSDLADALAEVKRLTKIVKGCESLAMSLERLEHQARGHRDRSRGLVSLLAGREANTWGEAKRRLRAKLAPDGPVASVLDSSAYRVDSDSNELVCNRCGDRRPKSAHGLIQLRDHTCQDVPR